MFLRTPLELWWFVRIQTAFDSRTGKSPFFLVALDYSKPVVVIIVEVIRVYEQTELRGK